MVHCSNFKLNGHLFTVLTYIYTPFYWSFATKKELLSTKSSFFVYPSHGLGLSSPKVYLIHRKAVSHHGKAVDIIKGALLPCISSRVSVYLMQAWYIITEGVYHPP